MTPYYSDETDTNIVSEVSRQVKRNYLIAIIWHTNAFYMWWLSADAELNVQIAYDSEEG